MDKIELLIKFFKKLWQNKFTGQLRLNFHEGNLSEKMEKKESARLDEDKFTTKDINKLRKALKKAGAKPTLKYIIKKEII